MKILHISAFALRGGCEKNCYHFIKGSPTFQHDIIVLDKQGPMTEDWQDLGLQVSHLDILKDGIIVFGRKLKMFLKSKRYDAVICWSAIRLPMQLNALNRITDSVKVYLGNPVNLSYKPLKDQILSILFPYKANVCLMACSHYVLQSHRYTSYYKRFEIKVSLNPVGIPRELSKNLNPSIFALGMVARLDPIKDHATVIKAFAQILRVIPHALLNLVGDGKLRLQLEELATHEGVASKLHFHGDVKNVYEHLNSWNVFIYATTPEEGLGSAVQEAMANGLPCVLSDLPMLRELAPSEGLALWFTAGSANDLANKVINLYSDGLQQKLLSNNARANAVKQFGVQRFINEYIN